MLFSVVGENPPNQLVTKDLKMNEKQSQELQELSNLESLGTIEDGQKGRLEELQAVQTLADKAAKADEFEKNFKSAEAQKEHFRSKHEAEEKARKDLEAKLAAGGKAGEETKGLKVEDFIDISASLEGLDQKEKERIAREHNLTGKPLSEIRKDDDFLLWQSAYRAKVEKEKLALTPNNRQGQEDKPKNLDDTLASATMEEKEKILIEMGYYKNPRSQKDRTKIMS